MKPRDKKMKALISSVISGNKAKSEQLARELTESILAEKEEAIFESFFKNIREESNDV